MIGAFTYVGLPSRVRFGRGVLAELADEIAALGAERALLITTPGRAEAGQALSAQLGSASAGLFASAVMHTPVDVTEDALVHLQKSGADCVVAVGGGSTIGLAKALALRTGVPQIAVPTTYAGSEMTPILGETKDGVKTTIRSLDVLPEVVLYDVDLTLGLPAAISATSGMNAIAHAVEALYAKDRNPVISLMAAKGISALAGALPKIVADPLNIEARTSALYGAWLCGCCLGSVGMALHHKLCHTLGGSFNLPHAETHTIVLPHAVAYNAPAAPDAMAAIKHAIGADDAANGLYDLAGRLGVSRALADLGVQAADLDAAADLAVKNPYWNPRPIDRAGIRQLLARAHAGVAPSADATECEVA